jgi:UDP-N-acetylglucosamine--N-acetylmuramyl-(pentapeptide) pyrophosphoryl-undecaprenol N-acetylglucosamine transferase
MKLLFSGGGTMGSVSPLLAVAERMKKEFPDCQMLWIGTKNGPEKTVVEKSGITFRAITSGKLRRYFSFQNFIDPFKILFGFFQALFIVGKFRPDIVVTAGSFVAVPVVFAAKLHGKKIIAHQQDILIGLANKLMFPLVDRVTVSFEDLLKVCPLDKSIFTGNPVRSFLFSGDKNKAVVEWKLKKDLPVLLVLGGGTGAEGVNKFFAGIATELVKICQVIHIFGSGKMLRVENTDSRYHAAEFLTDTLVDAYAAADLVISRAGISTLTELAALGKPTIIIPMPDSHQENNAAYFARVNAALYWKQKELDAGAVLGELKRIFESDELLRMSNNIKSLAVADAADRFVGVIKDLL